MIMDERTEFADATSSVAAVAGTALIGDVIDLGTVARDIGSGQQVFLVITVDTEIITAGAAGTIKFQLASDAQAAIATLMEVPRSISTPAPSSRTMRQRTTAR
jgi:hypothetical protein